MNLEIVAATRNPAKLAQMRGLVGGAAVVVPLPRDISLEFDEEESVEGGEGVTENAVAKAVAWSMRLPGRLVMASDGGLLVPALGERWRPARTRRFAGSAATDADRAARLLEFARGLREEARRIGWLESVAVARDGDLLAAWEAEGEHGLLAEAVDAQTVARGGGFWVPALWRCPRFGGRLLAELSAEERAGLDDHWARLAGPVRAWVRDYGRRARRS